MVATAMIVKQMEAGEQLAEPDAIGAGKRPGAAGPAESCMLSRITGTYCIGRTVSGSPGWVLPAIAIRVRAAGRGRAWRHG